MKYILIIMAFGLTGCPITPDNPYSSDVEDIQGQICAQGDAYYIEAEISNDIEYSEIQDTSEKETQ